MMADRDESVLASASVRPEPANVEAAWAELVYQSVRFANWAAGEGICPIADEPALPPDEFLLAFSEATGFEDWEGLDVGARERLAAMAEQRDALRQCQSALAMMVNPDRITGTTIMTAFATATAAEAKARKLLGDER